MVNFPAYLTRLELVPLCLQTQHSVRESSGFFFFSGGSMLLLPGRLPLFAAGAELSSNFGFCENQPQILISKRPQINAQVFWGICLRWTRSCIKHCISKWTEVYRFLKFPENCKFPWPNELTNSEISLWWTSVSNLSALANRLRTLFRFFKKIANPRSFLSRNTSARDRRVRAACLF